MVSFLTNNWPGMILGLMGVGFLWLVGLTREAKSFAVIGGIVGFVAFFGDFTLGEFVDRPRPLPEDTGASFPSGHTFGTTALFGFWGFLAIYYGLRRKILVPLLAILAAFIVSVGVSRIHLQAHWPSDVVAGYLLGILWLLVLSPLFLYLRKATWFSPRKFVEDMAALACEQCRIEKSIASVVVLDPEQGTATVQALPAHGFWPVVGSKTAIEYSSEQAVLLTVTRRSVWSKDMKSTNWRKKNPGGCFALSESWSKASIGSPTLMER
ncbi:MAG: phosphatase PAP2 family protein [Chloroflexi bacterium]|nr:phosphatase PAP2 family protein [Chloroflexota bacterium]